MIYTLHHSQEPHVLRTFAVELWLGIFGALRKRLLWPEAEPGETHQQLDFHPLSVKHQLAAYLHVVPPIHRFLDQYPQ